MAAELKERGYTVTRATLDEAPREGHDVVALLDREGPFLEDIDEARFEASRGISRVSTTAQASCG